MNKDYKVVDVKSLLDVVVRKRSDIDGGNWIIDDSWYNDIRIKYTYIVKFIVENSLLIHKMDVSNIDVVVIRFSDLTDVGKEFMRYGVTERWLSSFDRPGSKKLYTNTKMLEKELDKIR